MTDWDATYHPSSNGTVLRMDGSIDHAATRRVAEAREREAFWAKVTNWAGFEPSTDGDKKDLARRYARHIAAECKARSDAERAAREETRRRVRL